MRRTQVVALVAGTLLAGLAPAGTMGAGTADYAAPGPYDVEAREVVVERPAEDGGDFQARLLVPLPRAGAEVVSPVVVFGHGYLTPVDDYESSLRHLASWGLTTIAPRSQGGLLPDHADYARDLADAAGWVVDVAEAEGWPGLPVDPELRAVGGHSMGGGAAVLAAAADPRFDAVATLAAAETRPSAIEAAATLTMPTLFVAGSLDTFTPVDEHQRPMFETASAAPSQLRVIEGGSHCGFLDQPLRVGFICAAANIELEDPLALTRAALVAWLRYELRAAAEAESVAWPDGAVDGLEVESRQAPA
jgi:pimeloyl-ACP methyl ester carboxylesterase